MLLALVLACAPSPAPVTPRPGANVLLLTLDTVRADALGAYGAAGNPTPNLDTLASSGVRFDEAYTVTPLTIPAHASILTGLLPPRHGVRDNGDQFLGPDAVTLAERLHDAGYATMASVGAEVTSHHWGFDQGFDTFYDTMGTSTRKWSAERAGNAVVGDAVGWLDANATKKPWFAWVHLYDAHDPYLPPEPYRSRFESRYEGEVAYVDAQVGTLLGALDRLQVAENTWVFAVGDHGESLGEHGEATHGVLLYAATTRVPFLVRPPTVGAARISEVPVSLADVTPTILAALGLPAAGLDGADVLPFVAAPPPDRAVYAESLYAWRHFGWAPQRALMTSAWTLLDSTTPELYPAKDYKQLSSTDKTFAPMRERLTTLVATLEPAAAAAPTVHDAERAEMLQALGYLAGESASGRDATGAPLPGLPDPVTRLPVLAQVEKAQRAYRSGDLDLARATAEAAVAADPGLVETRMLLATILWRSGKPADAVPIAQGVDAERPSSQTKHLLGLLQLTLGHPEAAVPLLADAVARDPYNAAATETYLQTLLVLEDLPSLATAAAKAREHLPDSAVVLGMDGVSHALAADCDGALPLLQRAIALKSRQPFVHHALGLCLRTVGRTDEAIAAFEEEIRAFPPATPSRRALDAMR